MLFYACLGRRVFGAGFVHGCMGFATNGSSFGGELQVIAGNGRAFECEGGTRDGRSLARACQMAGGAVVVADNGD